MRSLDDALRAIRTAADHSEAGVIRNEVALQAMRGQRPESDADACRVAFFAAWAHALSGQPRADEYLRPRPGTNWTGD